MNKNKIYSFIAFIIIIFIFCSILSCISESQMDELFRVRPALGLLLLIAFDDEDEFNKAQAVRDAEREEYEAKVEYESERDAEEEAEEERNEAEREEVAKKLISVGTKEDFNFVNPKVNTESNPNSTLGEIGGQGKPEVTSVTLHGYVTGLEAHPLTITIFFTTGSVDGSFYHSSEGNCFIWDRDNKGNMIPGTKKEVYARYEFKGKITGWLNLKTYAVTGNMTLTGSVVYKGKVYPADEPGKVSGYLDKNNHLSCTVDNGYTITADP